MKKLVFIFFILILAISTKAQGLMELPLPPLDTIGNLEGMEILQLENSPVIHQNILSNLIFNNELFPKKLNLPDFKFDKTGSNSWQIDNSNFLHSNNSFYSPGYMNFNNPFISSGVIFNQATYNVSDKFVLGGNSFGANSIFSTSMPNRENYDIRGATMFMQYKVSKNIKIETRVSVTNAPHPYP